MICIDTNWYRRNRREEFDTWRATAALELDFGRAGRHRLAVMGERQTSNFWRDERREFWAGAPFNPIPENESNVVFRRGYVTVGDFSSTLSPTATSGCWRRCRRPVK